MFLNVIANSFSFLGWTKPEVKNCQRLRAISVVEPKFPSSSLRCSTCASTTTLSYSAQDLGETDSSSINNLICNNATETPTECTLHMHNKADLSVTGPQLESVDQNCTLDSNLFFLPPCAIYTHKKCFKVSGYN